MPSQVAQRAQNYVEGAGHTSGDHPRGLRNPMWADRAKCTPQAASAHLRLQLFSTSSHLPALSYMWCMQQSPAVDHFAARKGSGT